MAVTIDMKSVLSNRHVILIARICLGVVFTFASIDKLADPNAFAVSIGYYKLIGPSFALIVATVLPWMELVCGIFLIFGIWLRGSSLLTATLLIVFTIGVISGIARGLDISCGCFSRDPGIDKIGWMKVLENCGLIALSFLIFVFQRAPVSTKGSGMNT